jgi:hypothetical protein
MKLRFLLFIGIIILPVSAQKLVLNVHQNYIPIIIQNGDTLISSLSIGNQWFLDGTELEGENHQMLIQPVSGKYLVCVTDTVTNCSSYSEPFEIISTLVPIVRASDIVCNVYPNPNNGIFMITIDSDKPKTINLSLFSVDGKIFAKQQTKHLPGRQVIQFGKSNLSIGVYTLEIKYGTETIIRKLIIE